MFSRTTIAQSLTNPMRDTITDDESGLTIEVAQMSRELFVPMVHLEEHDYGYYIGFTNNPKDRYNGIYFILEKIPEDREPDVHDILTVAFYYCAYRKLPEPETVVHVTKYL